MDFSGQIQPKKGRNLKKLIPKVGRSNFGQNPKNVWFGRGSDVVRMLDVRMWFGAVRGQNLIFCDVVRTRFGCGSDVVRERFWSIFAHFGPMPSFFWRFGQTKPTCADFDCFRKQICRFWAKSSDWNSFGGEFEGIHEYGMHVLYTVVLPAVSLQSQVFADFHTSAIRNTQNRPTYWARK